MNKASAKDLETGLELASQESAAIIGYREAKGNFQDGRRSEEVAGLDLPK